MNGGDRDADGLGALFDRLAHELESLDAQLLIGESPQAEENRTVREAAAWLARRRARDLRSALAQTRERTMAVADAARRAATVPRGHVVRDTNAVCSPREAVPGAVETEALDTPLELATGDATSVPTQDRHRSQATRFPDVGAGVAREVLAAERRLLLPEVRSSRSALEALLHPGFRGVAVSGRVSSRDETITGLVAAGHLPGPVIDAAHVEAVTTGVALLTYTATGHRGPTRHSSLWAARPAGGWLLRFHQHTSVQVR